MLLVPQISDHLVGLWVPRFPWSVVALLWRIVRYFEPELGAIAVTIAKRLWTPAPL
jgi:hypothetical protein